MDTSSSLMLNSPARASRSSRIREDTCQSNSSCVMADVKVLSHHFALRNQLGSVKLSHDTLQNFIADGGENPLIIIQTEILVYFGEMVCVWA